jgi:hypothetical protein
MSELPISFPRDSQPQQILVAHHKGCSTHFGNLWLYSSKNQGGVELIQDALLEKPNRDMYDWFCFTL